VIKLLKKIDETDTVEPPEGTSGWEVAAPWPRYHRPGHKTVASTSTVVCPWTRSTFWTPAVAELLFLKYGPMLETLIFQCSIAIAHKFENFTNISKRLWDRV